MIRAHGYLADMYRPAAFDVADRDDLYDMVEREAFGHLVTVGPHGLDSTGLPFLLDRERGQLRGHLARANPHWRSLDASPTLVIFAPSDAFVSPSWYPSKHEHGRVVPTWNYEVVHVHGTVRVHDDIEWTRTMVSDITDRHESARSPEVPWAVSDAPRQFIDAQLRAIVGISVEITSIEGKRKLSQNRSADDRDGVVEGLRRSERDGDRAVAAAMTLLGGVSSENRD